MWEWSQSIISMPFSIYYTKSYDSWVLESGLGANLYADWSVVATRRHKVYDCLVGVSWSVWYHLGVWCRTCNKKKGFLTSQLSFILRGDVKIPHSRMTKTCWETLVTCLLNVRDKSQKAICTICWGYRITGPSQFCETSAKITDWVTDPLRWFCKACRTRGNFS